MPHLDMDAVLAELEVVRSQDEVDLRIAYLNPQADEAARRAGIPEPVFTTRVEQAELWRNTPGLDALIVVITEEDAAKLTSLEDFAHIGPAQLRATLVRTASGQVRGDQRGTSPLVGHDREGRADILLRPR